MSLSMSKLEMASLMLMGQFGAKLARYFGHLAPNKWPCINWPHIQYWVYVRPCVHTFRHEYLSDQMADHISSKPSLGWGGGLAALSFGPDWIRTPVSMATDSSHRVMWKIL